MLLKTLPVALGLVGVAVLAAVFLVHGRSPSTRVAVFDHITVGDQHITIHADGQPGAVISRDGSLSIGGTAQPASDVQTMHLKAYYDMTLAMRRSAIDAGREGLVTARTAASSVVRGLASGNPENIGDEVNQQAAKVDVHAKDIDARLAEMHRLQNEIVAGIPAFTPYAFLER